MVQWLQGAASWRIMVGAMTAACLVALGVAAVYSMDPSEPRPQRTVEYDRAAIDGSLALIDTDADGVPDVRENLLISTERLQRDSDGDGMPDAWEAAFGLNPNDPSDAPLDPDRDGLTNVAEFRASAALLEARGVTGVFDPKIGLDPNRRDTDGDGLPDGWEYKYGLDPLRKDGDDADTDGDGLTHREEFEAGSDPTRFDTDGDGLSDGVEVRIHRTDPTRADTDGDGMPDWWEIDNKLAPLDPNDRFSDDDGDGLLALAEYQHGTKPRDADSDADGIPDGWEVQWGLDPTSFADGSADPDADGLDNLNEYLMRETIYQQSTDPLNPDTDADGLLDGQEKAAGTNPFQADTDGDGLTDGEEIFTYGTNPLTKDTDGDGLTDGDEVRSTGTSPVTFDTDSDGIDDGAEWTYWIERQQRATADVQEGRPLPASLVAAYPTGDVQMLLLQMGPLGDIDRDGKANILDEDSDGDNLLDGKEIIVPAGDGLGCFDADGRPTGTDPANTDTDEDGMPDGWEVRYGLKPCDPRDATEDPDRDGVATYGKRNATGAIVARIIVSPADRPVPPAYSEFLAYQPFTNLHEYRNQTSPMSPDTDCDVLPDGWEVMFAVPDPVTSELQPNPRKADSELDLDGDGYDHTGASRNGRPAGDGRISGAENFTNLEEWYFFTDPRNNNTDGAEFQDRQGRTVFLSDGAEVYFHLVQRGIEPATPGLLNNGVALLTLALQTSGTGPKEGCHLPYADLPWDVADLVQDAGAPAGVEGPGQGPGGLDGLLAAGTLLSLLVLVAWPGRGRSASSGAFA